MAEAHHFVPRLIIKNFADKEGNIHFFSKNGNFISKPVPYSNQMQNENFYSNESLSKLKIVFDYIVINPIFKSSELPLEKNLDMYLESPMGILLKKWVEPLLSGEQIIPSEVDKNFIKEYVAIQHSRTKGFKKVSDEVHKKFLKLPSDIEKQLMETEHNRVIDLKKIIKENYVGSNGKERRRKLREWTKFLKKNPNFIRDIRNSEKSVLFMKEEIGRAEKWMENIRTSPDKHTSEIIDLKFRDNFFKRCNLQNAELRFVINDTKIPFILTDRGLVTMGYGYPEKEEIRVYLPIHKNILIELCQKDAEALTIDETYVKEFNQISKDDSLITVYSDSIEALRLLI